MSIAHIDIENSKTKIVDTLDLEIIEINKPDILFDISKLNESDLDKLKKAIDKNLFYTDIELFYIDDSSIPYFGPDFIFEIKDNKLIGTIRENRMNLYFN
jgi:hypothetical protein